MLAIISDLHFCDGTAVPAEWNVNARAMQLLMRNLYALARRKGVRQLDVVLLGDVFDILRSERWLTVPAAERPWGDTTALDGKHSPEALAHARAIVSAILELPGNAAALAVLRGEDPDIQALAPPDLLVRRIFLPGNHDRLYLADPVLRDLVRAALGAVDESALADEGISPYRMRLPRYGLLARHGHVWDEWNFERCNPQRDPSIPPEDYLCTPMGDPITTELVVRFPYELQKRLAQSPLFAEGPQLARVYRRVQRIEDVRPLVTAFSWIFYEAQYLRDQLLLSEAALSHEQSALLLRTGAEVLADLAGAFSALPFVQAWMDRHDRFGFDAADMLALTLQAMRTVSPRIISRLVGWSEGLSGHGDIDACQLGAAREQALASGSGGGLRFVVYGHTHHAVQHAMQVPQVPGQGVYRDLYLNSGTWRERIVATDDKQGFVNWRQCTYLVFYDESENQPRGRRRIGPAFDIWTGSRFNE